MKNIMIALTEKVIAMAIMISQAMLNAAQARSN
jgi:hypothetical protein